MSNKVTSFGVCIVASGLTICQPSSAALDCSALLSADKQRPAKTALRYQQRGSRCEGTIEQDHAGSPSPKLIVRRFTVGSLDALSGSTEVSLFGRGLNVGDTGLVTILAPNRGYRLDAELQGTGEIKWQLTDVFSQLALSPSAIYVVGRRTVGPNTTFFPIGVRKSQPSPAQPPPPYQQLQLKVQYPKQSPLIAVFLGTVSTESGGRSRCAVDSGASTLHEWRNVGDAPQSVSAAPDWPSKFCIRFEIQIQPKRADDEPIYDRQELFFVW